MQQKRFLGYIAALGYASIVGFSFIFVKGILNHADVIDVLTVRFGIAFIPLLLAFPFVKRKEKFSFSRIKILLVAGILYPFGFFLGQTFALNVSSSIEVSAVQATSPIFTLIFATLFLKEKTNVLQKLSVLICVSGVMYIMIMKFIKNTAPDFRGMLIALIGTICFSSYTVFSRGLNKKFSNFEMLFFITLEGFLILLGMCLGKNIANGTLSNLFSAFQYPEYTIGILYLAFLSTLASAFLINFALKNIESSKMIVFSNLGTVIQILAGVIIIKETLYPSHIIGSILIILGILGVNLLGNVDDVKNYIPMGWIILSILSFISAIFTFFMGTQNMAGSYIGSEKFIQLTAEEIKLVEIGNSYAMSFYMITLLFACLGIGFSCLYYLSSKRLAALKENERLGKVSYPNIK